MAPAVRGGEDGAASAAPTGKINELGEMLEARLPSFEKSTLLEVQERACMCHQLLDLAREADLVGTSEALHSQVPLLLDGLALLFCIASGLCATGSFFFCGGLCTMSVHTAFVRCRARAVCVCSCLRGVCCVCACVLVSGHGGRKAAKAAST